MEIKVNDISATTQVEQNTTAKASDSSFKFYACKQYSGKRSAE